MPNERFTILHDANGVFTDYSDEAENFSVDQISLSMVAAEDYLYVGLYKNFSTLYAELSTVSGVDTSLTGEFYNGTSWVALNNFRDKSNAFQRSGFLKWDLDQTNWTSSSVNGETLYWIRFKPGADIAFVLDGLALTWSDDNDLKDEMPEILDFLHEGQNSFIHFHQSVKKDIVQEINNRGRNKKKSGTCGYEPVTEFDFLKPSELRQTSKYKVLEKIYFNISDSVDDKYYQKYQDYRNKGSQAFELFYLTLDSDDDGVVDTVEKNRVERVRIIRA